MSGFYVIFVLTRRTLLLLLPPPLYACVCARFTTAAC